MRVTRMLIGNVPVDKSFDEKGQINPGEGVKILEQLHNLKDAFDKHQIADLGKGTLDEAKKLGASFNSNQRENSDNNQEVDKKWQGTARGPRTDGHGGRS